MRGVSAAAALIWLLTGGRDIGLLAQSLPTAWRDGIATNYGAAYDGLDPNNPSFGTESGGCGYGLLDKTKFPYWSVAALSLQNIFFLQGPQHGCGECMEIQCVQDGPNFGGRCNADPNARSATVVITDGCPECEPDHIDIQALTFNKIAPIPNGRIAIRYRRVECTPPSGITISVDSNYGAGNWLRLTVQKVANQGAVSLVQIEGKGSTWVSMNNLWGASWEIAQSPQPPLDLRVRLSDGSEVTAFSFINQNGEKGSLPTGVNFATSGNTTGVTAVTTLPGLAATDVSTSSTSYSASSSSSSGSSSQVSAYEGPNNTSTPATPQGGCTDVMPPGSAYQCYQQKQWGACTSPWMTQTNAANPKGYCAVTCGRC